MKARELREMTKEELSQKLKEFQEALFNLRFQHATAQLENTAQLKKVRQDVARAMTILKEMETENAAQG
jgi:large subunit ribosomal protein L29